MTKQRKPISLSGTMLDLIFQMSEGNPGAVTVLGELLKDGQEAGFMDILHLDDMGMRGSQIWVAYKDHCKGDVAQFCEAIKSRDPSMVSTVNASRGHASDTPMAVVGGASF